MKTILVTGSSGFIGSKIACSYAADGHRVIGIDVRMVPHLGFTQKECDLLSMDLEAYLKEIEPDIIVHCAGNANVGVSVADPGFDFQSNVAVLHRMLFAMKAARLKSKFVFLSSAAVYGNPVDLPISEDSAIKPISPYGLHKNQCEVLCEYFHRVEGIPTVVARIFSAYGSGLRKQLFWDLACKIVKDGPIELFGTGAETRDFIHVRDVVQAVRLLAEHARQPVYNVANGNEICIREAATLLTQAMGQDTARLCFNGKVKEGDPLYWRADIEALQTIGYSSQVSLADGLIDYAEWVKKDVH